MLKITKSKPEAHRTLDEAVKVLKTTANFSDKSAVCAFSKIYMHEDHFQGQIRTENEEKLAKTSLIETKKTIDKVFLPSVPLKRC